MIVWCIPCGRVVCRDRPTTNRICEFNIPKGDIRCKSNFFKITSHTSNFLWLRPWQDTRNPPNLGYCLVTPAHLPAWSLRVRSGYSLPGCDWLGRLDRLALAAFSSQGRGSRFSQTELATTGRGKLTRWIHGVWECSVHRWRNGNRTVAKSGSILVCVDLKPFIPLTPETVGARFSVWYCSTLFSVFSCQKWCDKSTS